MDQWDFMINAATRQEGTARTLLSMRAAELLTPATSLNGGTRRSALSTSIIGKNTCALCKKSY